MTLPASSQVKTTALLRYFGMIIGQRAEQQGIVEEEDLDPIIEQIQQQVYQEQYGA